MSDSISRTNLLLRGTFILTFTGILTRLAGFGYRIFLSRTFGEEAVGLYQLIFPVYALCISLTVAGIQTSLSRLTAKYLSLGQRAHAQRILKTALSLCILLSLTASFLLQSYAKPIATYFLHEPGCASFLVVMACAFPFAAVHSCICGYYYGQKATRIPAFSQLLEQFVRILSVYALYRYFLAQQKQIGIILAVAGLVFGEIASCFYTIWTLRRNDAPPCKDRTVNTVKRSYFTAFRELCILSVPLTANRVCLNILQSIEAVSIPRFLVLYGLTRSTALRTYGILTGMALPCILFPSAITSSLSIMMLPTVAEIQATSRMEEVARLTKRVSRSCFFLGFACMVLFLLSADFIGMFFFHSPKAGDFIRTLSFICPFLYVNSTYLSMINGLGKTTRTFFINLVSLLIRIGGIVFLIPIYGILGYLWGLLASQIFVTLACVYTMHRLLYAAIP